MAVGAASGALMDGSSAYLNGKRGSSLFKAVGTGALIGAATTGVGWGAGKAIGKGMSKLATKGIKPGKLSKYIRIERHALSPKEGLKIPGKVKNVGHINIGKKVHIIKPSTAKILRGKKIQFTYKGK